MKPFNKADFYIINLNDYGNRIDSSNIIGCASSSKPTAIVIHPDCTPEEAEQYIDKIMEWQKERIKLVPKTVAVEEI